MNYLLGLGSNIRPTENLPLGVFHLLAHFGALELSSVAETAPVEMVSSQTFLNAVAWLQCDLEPASLKAQLNAIEITLGRDRSDRERGRKDRPLDIDILFAGTAMVPSDLPSEPYLRPLAAELLTAKGELRVRVPGLAVRSVMLAGQPIGSRPARLVWEPATDAIAVTDLREAAVAD
ncbi:MAG: 2-amino-4-hydroxy-6-hydroxymethyldihydropteridine diphosphokinase [Pseudomonadota bacterium]